MKTRLLWLTAFVPALLLPLVSAAPPPRDSGGFDWPQWRGPDRTDISRETGLLKKWPADGPKRIWNYEEAGAGYSGPAIVEEPTTTILVFPGWEFSLAAPDLYRMVRTGS